MQDIRAFFALEITNEVVIEKITKLQNSLSSLINPIKLVEPENIHITLRFLGNISETTASELFLFMEKEINSVFFKDGPLEFDVIGLNDFNKRVFYVKLKGDIEKINKIHYILEKNLIENYDLKPDKKFKAHITIGRMKRRKKKHPKDNKSYINSVLYSKLKTEYSQKVLGKIKIKHICLKKSTLTPTGPIYENISF